MDLLNRTNLYTLNSFRADLGYTWKPDQRNEYKYNPISINYVQPVNVTQRYLDSIPHDFTLKKAIEKQFIIGSNVTYSYDEIIDDPKGKGWFVITNVDLSGNLIGLFTKPDIKNGDTVKFFGAPYAQYIKTETDVRHYSRLAKNNMGNRIDLGFGFPHGNLGMKCHLSNSSLLAEPIAFAEFRSRTLGPGTFRPANADSTNFYPDQSGDIKLEMNTELRQKISGILECAIFAEVGNIWLKNKNPNKPGGEFTNKFLSQLAVDAGIGSKGWICRSWYFALM